jgi:hypothetical protein
LLKQTNPDKINDINIVPIVSITSKEEEEAQRKAEQEKKDAKDKKGKRGIISKPKSKKITEKGKQPTSASLNADSLLSFYSDKKEVFIISSNFIILTFSIKVLFRPSEASTQPLLDLIHLQPGVTIRYNGQTKSGLFLCKKLFLVVRSSVWRCYNSKREKNASSFNSIPVSSLNITYSFFIQRFGYSFTNSNTYVFAAALAFSYWRTTSCSYCHVWKKISLLCSFYCWSSFYCRSSSYCKKHFYSSKN